MRRWVRLGRERPCAAEAYVRARLYRRRTPWRVACDCVVDLELSGLDARTDEIISFGAVPIDGGLIVPGRSLYGLARPTRPLREASVVVHGIRTVDLEKAPNLDESILALLEAMTGRVLVAHSAGIERAFLGAVLRRRGIRLRGPVLDTAVLGRLVLLERDETPPRVLSLSQIAASFGLPVHRPRSRPGRCPDDGAGLLGGGLSSGKTWPRDRQRFASCGKARLDNARHYSARPAVSQNEGQLR